MPDVPLRQLLLYAAVAAVVLVVGWRATAPGGGQAAPDARPAAQAALPAAALPAAVVVDVAGAVRRPGVYRLPGGARVLDAVRRAGPRLAADLGALNLAARVADGEQVIVPRRGEAAAGAPAVAGSAAGAGSAAIVHLNSATLEQLESLDGIGPALAQRIVDFRTAHGGFRALEDLDQVSGFGPARMAALRGHVAL